VRQELACYLGSSTDHLALVTNATSAVNAVLRSQDWQPRDEILLTDHGYNACANVATHLSQRHGVRVVTVSLPFPQVDSTDIVRAVGAAVSSRTRLALLDHVTSPTALLFPVAELAGKLSARGVKVMIDGAHAPGMLELDLEALGRAGVTYYTGNLHKWCCSPKGAAFLWVARKDQEGLRPPVISHGFNSVKERTRFLEEFDWCGTFDPTAWLAAPSALAALESLLPGGWQALRRHLRALLLAGREIVAGVLPTQDLAPPEMLGQMASLQLPYSEQNQLYYELYDEFGIDSMVTTWNGRTLLRLSAAPYNTLSDYHSLAAALRGIAARRGWKGCLKSC
jgi:isopenicillin-N epimerase